MNRFILAFALAIGLAGPARAVCTSANDGTLVTSSGPLAGSLYRFATTSEGVQIHPFNFSAGYTYAQTFFPSSDCTVRFLSIIEGGIVGAGTGTNGSSPALNINPVVGFGFYNSILRVLFAPDLITCGGGTSGILAGKVSAANMGLFVALGLSFDFSSGVSVGARPGDVAPDAEPPGFVRI